jgi:hypothetical protein
MKSSFKTLHKVLPKHFRVYDSLSHRMPHYTYPEDTMKSIEYKHTEAKTWRDKIAWTAVKFIRKSYDYFTRYDLNNMT